MLFESRLGQGFDLIFLGLFLLHIFFLQVGKCSDRAQDILYFLVFVW